MRTPAQASVNAIVREDIDEMKDQAKYEGMKSQIERLQKEFPSG